MSQQDLKELEDNIKDLQEMIDLGSAMERLRKNRDFKKVIEKEYLYEEAVRLVHLKSDPNMQGVNEQTRVIRDIDAIGAFTSFLNLIAQKTEAAKEAMNECEEVRAEIEEGTEA